MPLTGLSADRLLELGGLKARCSASLHCAAHGLALPCDLCELEGVAAAVCSACGHKFVQGAPPATDRACQSPAEFSRTGRVAFEADAIEGLRRYEDERLGRERAERELEDERRRREAVEREAAERARLDRERRQRERERLRATLRKWFVRAVVVCIVILAGQRVWLRISETPLAVADTKPIVPLTQATRTLSGARLSIFGLGPIRIGMNIADVESASGLAFRGLAEQRGQSCYYVDHQLPTGGISLLITNGHVAVVSVYGTGYATMSGVQPGDPESKVLATYRSGLSEFRTTDPDGSDSLIFVPKDQNESEYRMVFSLVNGPVGGAPSVVGSIDALRLPEGQYLLGDSAGDGCSDHIGAARRLAPTNTTHLRDASMLGELFVLSPNLKYAAATSYDPSRANDPTVRGMIRAWDVTTGVRTAAWLAHDATIQSLAISPSGDLLASSASDRSVALWRLPDGQHIAQWVDSAESMQSLSFDARGNALVGSGAKVVRIWNAATGLLRSSIAKSDGPTVVSPDGSLIASPSAVFDARTGGVVRSIEVDGAPMCMAFSPDGRYFALCQWDRIEFWDVSSWRIVWKFQRSSQHVPFNALAFHPNGQQLAATLGDSIWLLDIRTGEPIGIVPGSQKATTFAALGFDPGGNALVAVNGSQVIRWSAGTK